MIATTFRLPALATVLVAVAVACSGGDDAAPTTPPTTAAPVTTATTTTVAETTTTTTQPAVTTSSTTTLPEVVEVIRMPLTGQPIESADEIPQRPALAVKIDNHPRARPQAGLNEADVVFEENVEFLTRFAAVFHSLDADPVGPIRSGRSQDVGILSGLNRPLFAWSGGNAGVRALIRSADLVDLDAGFSPGYYRRSGRGGAPHNLYSSTQALWANTPAEWQLPPQIFEYLDPEATAEGSPANVARVDMDGIRVRWEFDAASGRYLRFQNDQSHQTELSGQVTTENVVVMGVDYRASEIDRASPEAQLVGSGPLVVLSAGVARTGTWTRDSISDRYRFTLDDGEPLGLVPGRAWVHLARNAENFVTWE